MPELSFLSAWTWRDIDPSTPAAHAVLCIRHETAARSQVFELGSPVAEETNIFLTAADAEAMSAESAAAEDESASSSSTISPGGSTLKIIVSCLVGLILASWITG